MAPRKVRVSKPSTSDGDVEKAKTSTYKNISQFKNSKKWGSWFSHKDKRLYIGAWEDEELAARAQDRAALKLKGPKAKTIFNRRDYKDDRELWPTMGDQAFLDMLVGESRDCYKPTPKSECLMRILERRSEMGAAPVVPNLQPVAVAPSKSGRPSNAGMGSASRTCTSKSGISSCAGMGSVSRTCTSGSGMCSAGIEGIGESEARRRLRIRHLYRR